MEFKELIAAFAAKYEIDSLDGASGAVMLDCDGVVVELLEDPHAHSIIACAEIGHPPPDSNGAFGAMMLQANFLMRGTDGATLCQNPETHAYAIVHPFPLALTDVASLAAGVESLVNQTEDWRKVLNGMHAAETERAKADEASDSHHDMISNGYFHV